LDTSRGVHEKGASDRGAGREDRHSLLEVVSLSKSYGAVQALDDVSLTIGAGTIHGLCGHNGAGKSTLVKLLVGLEQADAGAIRFRGELLSLHDTQAAQRYGFALVDQELSVVPELSVAENLFLGDVDASLVTRRRRQHARARELLSLVGLNHVSPRTEIGELPLGERQLVEIARLLGRKAKVLILDEPTATLTESAAKRVFDAIRGVVAKGATVVFVSHRLDEVLSLCHAVTVLRDGRHIATRPVGKLNKRLLVEMMLGEEGREDAAPAGTGRIRAGGLEIRHLDVGERVSDFSLDAPRGAIVGLAGQVGSGASEILRAVAGLAPSVSGFIDVQGERVRLAAPWASLRAGIHFVPNDRQAEGLFLQQSVENNLLATRLQAVTRAGVLRPRRVRGEAARLAELVGIESRRLSSVVTALSGGNQQKVLVGRSLERPELRVLLLDDPTRGVDVGGRAEIHGLIRHAAASGATVVFASAELDEILELSDRIITLFAGRVVSVLNRSEATASHVLADMTQRAAGESAS
jgi:ABC-type sugar transport system ATPase subunit